MSSRLRRRIARALPGLAVLLFWGLAMHQFHLPGFYYDEALDLPAAVQLAHGQPASLMPGDPGLTLGGQTYPLMILDYLGAIHVYLLWPAFRLLGGSWWLVRWFEIALGALIVALASRLARAWFGASVAGLTALLLAVNPSFIFWTRMGISVSSIMAVCSLASLLCLTRWARSGGDWRWGPAGWLLGLGLWAKLLFLWWLDALAGVYLLLGWRRWRPRRGELLGLRPAAWLWGALGLAAGAFPLLYFNLATGQTWQRLAGALTAPTSYGVNNLDLAGNLRAAWGQFLIFLDGSYFWYNGELQSNPWAVRLYALALAVTLALCWRWPAGRRRRYFAVLLLSAALVVQSAFTVSGIWATHLYLLVPFPQIVAALAALETTRLAPRRLNARAGSMGLAALSLLGGLLVLGLFGGDLAATVRYHQSLARYGGFGRFSDAIYTLADELLARGQPNPTALDWGLEKNLFVLTDGRLQPQEIFGYSPEPDAGFAERVRATLCDGCVFVDVDPAYAVFPRAAAFRAAAAEAGYRLAEEIPIRERSGQPAYWVYVVRPKP